MKVTEDVRKFAAQQQISEEEALRVGLEAESERIQGIWRRSLRESVTRDIISASEDF
jgi:hypothetical protein